MAISVIVSNFNGARYLPKLLESLKSQQGVTLEIIIVDRHSTDESAAILAQHPDVRVVKEPPESGLVAGYHAGVPHARYEHLFFCNEDMWFTPDCLRRLEEHLNIGVRVGAVMPMQLTYDGNAVVNTGIWFRKDSWSRANPYPFRGSVWEVPKCPAVVSGINAGACLIHRQAYSEVSGWDTTFFLDYEDMDISIRLWQQGWLCQVDPQAIVYHAVGASNEKVIENGRSTVGRKRYICSFSNQLVIAWKYFSGWLLLLPLLLWVDRVCRDFLKGRFSSIWLDLEVAKLCLKRLPSLVRFRRENRNWNRIRPGQKFFTEPSFDFSALIGDKG